VQRFLVDPAALRSEAPVLEGAAARQIAVVLRMQVGESVILGDGAGNEAICTLAAVSPRRVVLEARRRQRNGAEATLAVHLYPALLRGPRFELVLQKVTELGVAAITPVICRRSVARPPDSAVPERWRSIVREAVEQSGRGRLPALAAPLTFPEACAAAARAELAVCCSVDGGTDLRHLLAPAPPRMAALIGPEGGLDPEEVAEAVRLGLTPVTLGARTLRAETAAIAVCAAAYCLAGDWQGPEED
jgi:16S rRNA (uracil1498-N3)-methyltransferase